MRKHDWQPPSLKPTAVKQCVSFILTFALKMDGLSPLGEIIWAQPCPWCDAFLSPSGTGVSSPPLCADWVSHSRTQNNCLIQCHHYTACRQSHQAFPRKLAAFHKSFAQSSSPEGTEMSQLHRRKRITNKYLSCARSFMEDYTECKNQLKCFISLKFAFHYQTILVWSVWSFFHSPFSLTLVILEPDDYSRASPWLSIDWPPSWTMW